MPIPEITLGSANLQSAYEMSRIPISLQEPETPNFFMFVPQKGAPVKDAATRNHLRQQVMQHIGRNRRRPGLNRPKPILQYSLDVSDDFVEGSAATSALDPSPFLKGARENASNSLYKTSQSNEVTKSYSNTVVAFAPDFQKFSFDRVGIGSLDPFAKYPFRLDHRARELMWTVQGSNSGTITPFKVVAFRVIWIEVGMLDPAAFHQYLAGAQAYFDFLHKAKAETLSHQVVSHRACALRLTNSKVANAETASSDGVIASLVLLARYYQMIGDFGKWQMHMLGLREIIRLRGDIDAIGINDLLRHMLSNIDISGSFALDTPPIFRIPVKLLPSPVSQLPTLMLEPLTTYFIAVWGSRLPDSSDLINIIRDTAIENLHFRHEIIRTQGTLWTETMYICYHINPLLHRLLCIPERNQSTPSSFVAEAFRLGTSIYLAAIRYAFGITPFQPDIHTLKIKALLERSEQNTTVQLALHFWQEPGWSWVRVWILSCAVISRPAGIDREWFLERLHMEMAKMGMENYDDFEGYIGSYLWIPEVHGVLLRGLDTRPC